jgi:hypothetical protein
LNRYGVSSKTPRSSVSRTNCTLSAETRRHNPPKTNSKRTNVPVCRIHIEPSGLTVAQAARALRKSPSAVRRLIAGPLRAHRYTRELRILRSDLAPFLAVR